MLLAMVAMVQGNRVNKAVSAHSEAEFQGEVIGSVHANFAFANQNRSGCNFVGTSATPGPEKGDLSEEDFAAIEADPNIVAYTYGPAFNGKGQILAWSYLGAGCTAGSPEYLWAFYPKSPEHSGGSKCARERLTVTPKGKCSNTPGMGSCKLCPSCSNGWGGCSYESNKFPIGSEINLGGIVTATLVDTGSGFRLAGADGEPMDKRIFACSFSMTGSVVTAQP